MKRTKTVIEIREKDRVSGVFHLPDEFVSGRNKGVILAHGAGNDMNNPLIVSLSDGLAQKGFTTLRFNFPYKEKGRKSPDPQSILESAWISASTHMEKKFGYKPANLILGGKSMGGRIVSHLVAEGRLSAGGLVFYGYPLHPPGNTEKLRDAHLYAIKTSMLFFAGTRDPLCRLDKLEPVLSRLQAPFALEIINGGDHSFGVLKSLGLTPEQVYGRLVARTVRWILEGDGRSE